MSRNDFHFRVLEKDDYNIGVLDVLNELKNCPRISKNDWNSTFAKLNQQKIVIVCVHEPTNKIAACGSLLVEQKFSYQCSCIGYKIQFCSLTFLPKEYSVEENSVDRNLICESYWRYSRFEKVSRKRTWAQNDADFEKQREK